MSPPASDCCRMLRRVPEKKGYTMLEIVVGIVLLTLGALGYAAVTAGLARSFLADSRRGRAGELLDSQREIILREGCGRAQSGAASSFGMPLEWRVGPAGGNTRAISLTVSRTGTAGVKKDSLSGSLPCT
jgi:hypothetical protein